MRGFSIFVWCVVTALMFYSAWRFKAPDIQTDIHARVSEGVSEAGGQDVAVEVDGRHVNLRGFAANAGQKADFLDTADTTYGALGPIDGLMLPSAPTRTFLSAARTSEGVVLSGVVGTAAEREMLVTQAKAAGLGNVQDDLTVSDGQIDWTSNAETGFAQLASLESGHLYVSDDRNTISGNAPTVEVATAASALGTDWNAFVAGPVLEDPRIATLQGEVADRDMQLGDLNTQIGDRDGQIGTLNTQISGFQNDLSMRQNDITGLQTTIKQKNAHITLLTREMKSKDLSLDGANQTAEVQAGRITDLEAELANKATMTGNMETEIANMTSSLALLRQDGGEQSANLEAALAEKTSEVKELESELVALNTSKDRTITDLNTTIADLTTQNTDLTTQKNDADKTLVTSNQARVDDKTAHGAELAALKNDLETMTGSLGKTNEARVAALNQSKDLEAQLETRTAEVTDLNARLEGQSAEVADLTTKLADQNVEFTDLTAKLAGQNTQIVALTGETKTLKDQLAELDATRLQVGQLETTVTDRDAKIAALMLDLNNKPAAVEPQTVAQCNDTATGLLASGKINFVTNSADILDESEPLLERITGVVLACSGSDTDASVTVAGHTDDRGSESDNQALSEARALSVAQFMTERGVDPKALTPVGFGESKPIADNETTEGRAENRRISFEFQAR